MSIKQGVLYIVATPIGNLADMGQRAIDVLSNVDLIAAEDTRHSRHLLSHFNINASMVSYHEHNEQQKTPQLIEKLLAGDNVALISDAGTPLLSDPGYRLVRAAHEAEIQVSPVPGACAAIAALSVSGLATDSFYFAGFPPAKSASRKALFESLIKQQGTLIFYESGHRIVESLADMAQIFGAEREILLARELTKTFETVHKSTLSSLLDWVAADENQRKGEFVLVVQGCEMRSSTDELVLEVEHLLKVLMEDLPLKQASQLAAKITGLKKNQLYKMALELSDK